jgi:hypothetical protein
VCGHKQRTMLCMLVTDATFHLLMSPLKLVASFNCEFITRKAEAHVRQVTNNEAWRQRFQEEERCVATQRVC